MKKQSKKRPEHVKVPRRFIDTWADATDATAREAEHIADEARSLARAFSSFKALLDAPAPKQLVRRKQAGGRRGKK